MAQEQTLDQIIKTVKDYLMYVEKSGIDVERGILFGSFAKGTAKKDSDIDLCVVSSEFGKDPVAETARLKSLTWDIDPSIEVVPYSPQDLAVEEDPLAHEIRTHGLEIKI
jgi:predicted nucleotidyltransferase